MSDNPKYKLSFGKITPKNLELVKLITQLTLPVTYSEHFYQRLLQYDENSLLAYFNDILVGDITCREEPYEGLNTFYIMTFGVLEAYRRLGFGSQLLKELEALAVKKGNIDCIYLHMWVQNETGYQFYLKHGFQKLKEIPDYYTDIEPKGCYILMKKLK